MTQIHKPINERGDITTDNERQKNIKDHDEPVYTNQIMQRWRNG